jgi:NAD-specific glutamate dehydrogenase
MAGGAPIDEAIDGFLASREEAVDRLQRFLRSLGIEGVTDLSQLTVALRQIRALVG